jgi:5,10-methylenetetrahydromethanopterin reductase
LPKEPIPVLIGTWGSQLCALAGELADEVKIGGTSNPDIIPVIQSYIRAGEVRTERDAGSVKVVAGAVCVIDEDREQARSLARREVALYLPVVANLDPTVHLESELVQRLQLHAARHEYEEAGRLISDDLLDRFAFSGNVDDIMRQVEALFAAGASRIEFGTPHGVQPVNGIRMLGERVVPMIRRML